MREVQAAVAESQFAALLRDVERGESIAITRNGEKVAELVPAEDAARERRERAMDRFMEMRSRWKPIGMSREEILAARHEGLRF